MSLRKKIFMFNKVFRDLRRGDNYYQIATDVNSEFLGEYYFVFNEQRISRGKDQALITTTDENGIPLNKTYIDIAEQKLFYFPISIGQMGLSVFHTYLNSSSKIDLKRFLKFADWFVDNAEIDDRLGALWITDVDLPAYRRKGPWQSAFSQSRALSILLRAYQHTEKEEYKHLAEQALTSFQFPASEGGVYSPTGWGPFYEEYTAEEPVLVLNGHIFALFGLYDYVRIFPDNQVVRDLFDTGYDTVINALPDFDLGYWSRYNFCRAEFYPDPDPATLTYQRLHIMQLKVLNTIRHSPALNKFIDRWSDQINTRNYLKAQFFKYLALKRLGRI